MTPIYDFTRVAAIRLLLDKEPDEIQRGVNNKAYAMYKELDISKVDTFCIGCEVNGEMITVPFSVFEQKLINYRIKMMNVARGQNERKE